MEDTIVNFLMGLWFDPDGGYRVMSNLHHAAQVYQTLRLSDWGFPVIFSIALFMTTLVAIHYGAWTLSVIQSWANNTWLAKKLRKYKGRIMEQRRRKEHENRLAADIITDAMEQAVLDEKLTRKRVQMFYEKIGKALNLPDLIPTSKAKQEKRTRAWMGKMKHDLKAKHGTKIVDFIKHKQEVQAKSGSLKDRFNRQREAKKA